ncbi:MAG TPA: tetratricopeptide repeat protein [Pyrinomonadaceae bacterium]|nr:tetratricopeptide repeat protein [Pyrinomonadaceae bacterium]
MARILTTLRQASNPGAGPILLDVTVWFILRAAMIPRALQLLILVVVFSVCADAVLAQRLPKSTGREPENKAASVIHRPKPRPRPPASTKSPASIESYNFLDLGNTFREQKKWNAAEAAYKEAVNVWSGNADALLELGFLYLDRNRIDDAQQTHAKLRSVNASYASDLLAEITRRKNAIAH